MAQFAPRSVERVRQRDLDRTDADGDQVFGDLDVVPGESDDILDLLSGLCHDDGAGCSDLVGPAWS